MCIRDRQDVVLKDAQQLNLDSLYRLPTLGTWPPEDSPPEDGSLAQGNAGA